MDKDRIRGEFHQARGKLKELAGKTTGSRKLKVQGKVDRAKGKAESVFGRLKDKVRSAT